MEENENKPKASTTKVLVVGYLGAPTSTMDSAFEHFMIMANNSNIEVKTCQTFEEIIDYKEQFDQYSRTIIEDLGFYGRASFENIPYCDFPKTHEGKWFDNVPKNKIRNRFWK